MADRRDTEGSSGHCGPVPIERRGEVISHKSGERTAADTLL